MRPSRHTILFGSHRLIASDRCFCFLFGVSTHSQYGPREWAWEFPTGVAPVLNRSPSFSLEAFFRSWTTPPSNFSRSAAARPGFGSSISAAPRSEMVAAAMDAAIGVDEVVLLVTHQAGGRQLHRRSHVVLMSPNSKRSCPTTIHHWLEDRHGKMFVPRAAEQCLTFNTSTRSNK